MGRWGSFQQRARATRTGRLTLRIAIGFVGTTVVLAGLVLVPLPGPGWLIVLAGLAILSLEFAWAQRLRHFTHTRLERWWHWLGRQHWAVRALAGLIGIAFAATVAWLSWTYGTDLLT
jgi:uncharacterized protein (TIGR02611 family)